MHQFIFNGQNSNSSDLCQSFGQQMTPTYSPCNSLQNQNKLLSFEIGILKKKIQQLESRELRHSKDSFAMNQIQEKAKKDELAEIQKKFHAELHLLRKQNQQLRTKLEYFQKRNSHPPRKEIEPPLCLRDRINVDKRESRFLHQPTFQNDYFHFQVKRPLKTYEKSVSYSNNFISGINRFPTNQRSNYEPLSRSYLSIEKRGNMQKSLRRKRTGSRGVLVHY